MGPGAEDGMYVWTVNPLFETWCRDSTGFPILDSLSSVVAPLFMEKQ
jgi:deoxyribodipyrimidine photolyase